MVAQPRLRRTIRPAVEIQQLECDILRAIYKILDQKNVIQYQNGDHTRFCDHFENLHQVILQQAPNIQFIVLFDDFDQLYQQNKRNYAVINERLKALLQSKIGSFFKFIVTITYFRSESDFIIPMRFVRLKPLGHLEIEKIILDFAAQIGFSYDKIAQQKIHALSGGFPYYCKTLCNESIINKTIATNNKEIHLADVEIAQLNVTQKLRDHYYLAFWKYFDSEQRQFVSALARNKKLPRIFNGKILQLINDYQLIQEIPNSSTYSNQKYRFSAELFQMWTQLMI